MLLVGALLAVLMGVALGLLGGGGSILTVPILVYVLDTGAKEAIATSLLVVGVTSLAGLVSHARTRSVEWRTGLVFGGVAMVGAYGGGLLARLFSGDVLLILFAVLMAVTGAAMLRGRGERERNAKPRPFIGWKVALEGLGVGAVTGLVGAGGGFLVVPALVLLGGLDMRRAIGTSLLVIAMKSFAGLGGHLSHVDINWGVAGAVSAAAVIGTFAGAAFAQKLDPARLRQGFAAFVLVMAAVMVYGALPAKTL